MAKSSAAVLTEFAASLNRIVGAIGYIQCYDIADKKYIPPVTADVTLSNIEIKTLKISKALTPEQLNYTIQASTAVIQASSKGLTLAMEAGLSLKWTYKVMGATIYSGTYTAQLLTDRPALLFTLFNMTEKSTGALGFTWLLKGGEVKGFGASSYIKDQLEETLQAKLFRVLNEELNRYNDIIVNALIYNYFYRQIPLPFTQVFNDVVTLKNLFHHFYVSPNYVTFHYLSSLYLAINHTEIALTPEFAPIDTHDSPISLYLGLDSMKQIFDLLVEKSPMKKFVITPEDQKKVLKYPLTVGVLSSFYPRFSEEYEPSSLININCALKPRLPSATKSLIYSCQFVLVKDPNAVLLDLSELVYTMDIAMAHNPADTANKTVMVKQTNPRFTKLAIRSPLIPHYLQVQLLSFLQPLSKVGGTEFSFSFPIVGPQSNWVSLGVMYNDYGDATFNYRY